ncbi:MAG: hypothetical protein R3B74_11660 [Nitrospirales bacterium]|nr:hypothetical protein [Nitrospirales bacterium]
MMSHLESTEVAAKAVGLSKWFLYRNWPNIPAAYRAGKALRWDVEALKTWMREQADQSRTIGKERGR